MIISGLEANKCILRHNTLFTNKVKRGLFNYIVLQCIVFYDVNLAISPLDRHWI